MGSKTGCSIQEKQKQEYRYKWRYTNEERVLERGAVCYDCGLPYTEFHDMVIPDSLWEEINPTEWPGAGLLCPTCIANRLDFIGKWYSTGIYQLAGDNKKEVNHG